jgi:hypothetical protein
MAATTAIIGGAALLGGAYLQSRAASKASKAQRKAAGTAAGTELEMYYQTREDIEPWREAGEWALWGEAPPARDIPTVDEEPETPWSRLSSLRPKSDFESGRLAAAPGPRVAAPGSLISLIKEGPGKFEESPGYQFRLSEGEKAIERAASARGKRLSGQTLKELARYSQEYATSEYDKFLARYYAKLNPLQSLAQIGQTTALAQAQLGQQTASNVAGHQLAGGQARASGYINQGNIWSNLLQQGAMGAIAYGKKSKSPIAPQIIQV